MDSSHGRIVQKDESMSTRKLVDIFLCENSDGLGKIFNNKEGIQKCFTITFYQL